MKNDSVLNIKTHYRHILTTTGIGHKQAKLLNTQGARGVLAGDKRKERSSDVLLKVDLLELVQERSDGCHVFTIGDQLSLELDAGVSTELAFEVGAKHLLALRTVTYAGADVDAVSGDC